MSGDGGLDWPGLMRAGMHRLRLPPETFWALTPAELWMMLGDQSGPRPMLRDGLAAMMTAWPDSKAPDEKDRHDGGLQRQD